MPDRQPIVFLFDVDNTLLDNDRVTHDLSQFLDEHFRPESRQRYFEIFEALRAELGYADYLGALQRYRTENPLDVRLLSISNFLLDYPFAERLYPDAIEVLAHCRRIGPTVILSDGDVVFQPRKIRLSGIGEAVGGNVLVYIHKELVLDDVERRYPADHYFFIDDKPRLVEAVKKHWKQRVTTILPRQGHYALDPRATTEYPPADVTIERIGDLMRMDMHTLPELASHSTRQRNTPPENLG